MVVFSAKHNIIYTKSTDIQIILLLCSVNHLLTPKYLIMNTVNTNPPIKKGDKKTIRAWIMYDWSNSVYQLTIATAIFPIYYNQITRNNDTFIVDFFGFQVVNTVLYSWSIAFAYFIVAVFSPFFSSLADYTGRRKTFMKVFTFIGAISCSVLFFFDPDHIELGVIAFTLGTLGYGGSLVFYNSFLPVIAEPEDYDRISAQGYSMGYLGGVVLLVLNLILVLFPNYFGITDPYLPAKISFLSVGIWWIGFSQITFRRLPKYTFRQRATKKNLILNGYSELNKVFHYVLKDKILLLYLPAFFFFTMGMLTVMFMAATYGEKQLGLKEDVLIPIILIIQLVGMFGAWLFSKLSGKIGNFHTLIIAVISWILICIGAYYIVSALDFVIVAFFVGLVMGGSQALARSTYSKLLPETTDHTSFFSFYDVMEKMAIVLGTFSFGAIEAITGSMRTSVLSIIVFFIISLVIFLILIKLSNQLRVKQL